MTVIILATGIAAFAAITIRFTGHEAKAAQGNEQIRQETSLLFSTDTTNDPVFDHGTQQAVVKYRIVCCICAEEE